MLLWVACSRSTPSPVAAEPSSGDTTAAAVPTEAANDPRFHADLLAIANSYASMTRADGTYWAPEDCRAPVHPAFASEAKAGPHGKKLYTLFVSDYASYAALAGHDTKAPKFRSKQVPDFAQTIVKEAWAPVETSEFAKCKKERLHSHLADVVMDGKTYRACEAAGLFIMYQPKAADGTDDGWVYGTVAHEQRPSDRAGQMVWTPRVTSSGRVASCMHCHDKAPHGRLFGPRAAR